MASGWTESGVDWDNLSSQSPRDVIRELYVAVDERNYWIKYFATGGYNTIDSLTPIDYDVTQRQRTKDQIDYILSTIKKWLRSTTDFRGNNDDIDVLSSVYGGCFIDYESGSNYTFDKYGRESELDYSVYRQPYGHEELALGYKPYNAEENGNTESLINSDLSFIRDYGSSFRFTYEMMRSVYDILNNLNYIRCAVYRQSNVVSFYSNLPNELYFLSTYFGDSNGSYGAGFLQSDLNFSSTDFSVFRQYYYDTLYGRNYNQQGADAFRFDGINTIFNGGVQDILWQGSTKTFNINTPNSFLRFQNIGYNQDIFRTSDFDLKSLTYGINFRQDIGGPAGERVLSPSDYTLTSRPFGHTILDNRISTLTNANTSSEDIQLNYQGDYWNLAYGNLKTGDIPNSVESTPPVNNNIEGSFVTQYLPLINFNKEGFLKYYTEPTN